MLLMPLLTMWHEIGGHAAACALQGGHVATIGAFYVDCTGLARVSDAIVACAGVAMNAVLAVAAYLSSRRARGDAARLVLWLIWVSEAFVASGYFLFSGITGFGDLGIGKDGSLSHFGLAWPTRVIEVLVGAVSYVLLVRAATRSLNLMIGSGPETQRVRRSIAHVYYASVGASAVVIGLFNPVGVVITIMSAAASSFGGLAGFISIGYAVGDAGEAMPFRLARNLAIVCAGLAVSMTFGFIFGASLHFALT